MSKIIVIGTAAAGVVTGLACGGAYLAMTSDDEVRVAPVGWSASPGTTATPSASALFPLSPLNASSAIAGPITIGATAPMTTLPSVTPDSSTFGVATPTATPTSPTPTSPTPTTSADSGTPTATTTTGGTGGAGGSGGSGVPTVVAGGETAVLPDAVGDVTADTAIWRNPEHPDQSLVLAADRDPTGGGVGVYRLDGTLLHFQPAGQIGGIDVRPVHLGNQTEILVAATDRTHHTLRLWTLDPTTGGLTPFEARALPVNAAGHGLCLGRDSDGPHTYAFVTSRGTGQLEQYELWLNGGKIDAALVRRIDTGTVAENCVVDDTTASVYLAEEQVGVWRHELDPSTGSRRTLVDRTDGGHLAADVKGLVVVRGADNRGFLIASSQGDSTFAVYDADAPNAFRGRFAVRGGGSVDGVSLTAGLDAAAGGFGPRYPGGLFVVHDADNRNASGDRETTSNLKLVRLDQVVVLSGAAAPDSPATPTSPAMTTPTGPTVMTTPLPTAPRVLPGPASTPAKISAPVTMSDRAAPSAVAAQARSYDGTAVSTRFGTIQVRITTQNGRITAARAIRHPDGDSESRSINDYALPILNAAVVKAQSAKIDSVSGATVTSTGYISSLQAAVDAARL